jgi:NADH-quinone oxidoreductase subunit N
MLNMAIATKSLLILLLSICGISLITYVLIAFDRTYLAIEASVKYFTMSALVTGFMCFGYLILSQYNLMSNIMLDSMDQEGLFYKNLLKTSSGDGASYYFINLSQSLTLLNFGFILFLSGFIFKLSLFPFFSWAPDVYEGSPLYVVSFMVILVKFVIFCVFLRFFNSSPLYIYCVDMLSSDSSIGAVIWFLKICGFASVGIGAIGAITQQRLKRFVAYTSINQMGLMLLGILYDPIAVGAIFNIFVYVSTSLIFFGVLMSLKRIHNDTRIIYMNELHNLFESSPSSTILLTISILSISGIPPLLGFFSKYMMFIPIFKSGLAASFYILFFHTVAMFNYLRVLRDIWFTDNFKDVVFFRFLSKWSFRIL